MSVLAPTEKEPTHEEFIVEWLMAESVSEVSLALHMLDYPSMTPKVCTNWFKTLKSLGVRLPHRRNHINRRLLQYAS